MAKDLQVHPSDYTTGHVFIMRGGGMARAACHNDKQGPLMPELDAARLQPCMRRHYRCPICVTKVGSDAAKKNQQPVAAPQSELEDGGE